jgi:hypothetical protein
LSKGILDFVPSTLSSVRLPPEGGADLLHVRVVERDEVVADAGEIGVQFLLKFGSLEVGIAILRREDRVEVNLIE